jgi:hypothetical protein
MSKTLGDVQVTERGFQKIVFGDTNNERCSLQASSAIDGASMIDSPGCSFVWLGIDYGQGNEKTRMHLNRDQVKALRKHLKSWLQDGVF